MTLGRILLYGEAIWIILRANGSLLVKPCHLVLWLPPIRRDTQHRKRVTWWRTRCGDSVEVFHDVWIKQSGSRPLFLGYCTFLLVFDGNLLNELFLPSASSDRPAKASLSLEPKLDRPCLSRRPRSHPSCRFVSAMGLSSQIWLLCMFPSTCQSHVSFSDAMPCPCPPARARSLRRRSLLVAADGSTWDQFWSGQAFR